MPPLLERCIDVAKLLLGSYTHPLAERLKHAGKIRKRR